MMKKTYGVAGLLLTSMMIAQTPDEAIYFLENEEGIGVKATAMGNAFTAVADDYTAIYWNPAGLALLNASEITGDLNHLSFNNEARFAGVTQLEKQTFMKLKTLGLAYKFPASSGSFVLGLGINRFKDFDGYLRFSGFNPMTNDLVFELENNMGYSEFYNFDRNVFQTEEISEKGNLNALAIGAGVAMSPNFNLGATIQFLSGKYQYDLNFYQEDTYDYYFQYPANYLSYELNQHINTRFSGLGLKLGGLFHVNEEFRLGVSVDLPTALHVYETWSFDDVLIFDDDYISETDQGPNEWEYVVRYPIQLSGGVALNFKQLLLAASCHYRDWTQVEFDVPDGANVTGDYSQLLGENSLFCEQFRPVVSWSIGGELLIPGSHVRLRGGYRVVPSPLYGADKSLDKRYFSGGVGFDLDHMSSIHVTYVKGLWNRDTVDSYTPGGTHENIRTDRLMAGLTLRLD